MALSKIDPVSSIDLADKEYFHVDLTTSQTGLTDATTVNVDFGGSGTVKYDTKSNFDSTNDAYLLDSSDGVYLISYSVGVRSTSLTSEAVLDAAALLRVATDGSTFSPVQGSASHPQDENANEIGSLTLNNTFIYKATTATTKIDLQSFVNTSGGVDWVISDDVNDLQQGVLTGGTTARCTFLSIVRIA
jgi:hypothetical protein